MGTTLFTALCLFTPAQVNHILASEAAKNSGFIPALIGIPIIYTIGIVSQAVTWGLYRRYCHRPSLKKEKGSERAVIYNVVSERMKGKHYRVSVLNNEMEELDYGKDLGKLLDMIRFELFRSGHEELSRQYLIQFHLYRVCYGSIIPLFVLGMTFIGGAIKSPLADYDKVALLLIVSAAISFILCVLAFIAAKHRRTRVWKYLIMGMQGALGPE